MFQFLLVMLGGALGAGLRHGLSMVLAPQPGAGFPWSTFVVNLSGGLAAGLLLGILASRGDSEPARMFLGVGLLGGFTTFSAFSAETAGMLVAGEAGLAALYAGLSVAGAVGLLLAGLWLARVAT